MWATPIQSSAPLAHTLRDVEVGVGVEIDQADTITGRDMSGDRSDPDCAIPAKDKRGLGALDGLTDSASGIPDDVDDIFEVLRSTVVPIRAPSPELAIPVIVNLDS